MKRITITIDDDIYTSLVDYAAETCKEDLTRLSVSRAIRKLLANRLEELSYLPAGKTVEEDDERELDEHKKTNQHQSLRVHTVLASHEKSSSGSRSK
jgi:predicted CopG family antitoxin